MIDEAVARRIGFLPGVFRWEYAFRTRLLTFCQLSKAGLMEIWREYVLWQKEVMPALAEGERLFSTEMNGLIVWVIEDEAAFTLLYPEDY